MTNIHALPTGKGTESTNTSKVSDLPPANQLDALLNNFNVEFAVVPVGAMIRILWEQKDPTTGAIGIDCLAVNDFKLLTKNRIDGNLDGQSASEFWLKHPKRRYYRKIDFAPGGAPSDVYNLWQGFAVTARRGQSEKFWALVLDVICAGDNVAYQFVRRWLAHLVQRPHELPGTALVMRGDQGTGKNTFADTIGRLVGHHYLALNSLEQVTGRFNGHLANKLLIHANEAIWGGDKKAEGALKALITDPVLAVEYKHKDTVRISNYKRLIVSSNEKWAVPRGMDDRRFFVLDVSIRHKEDQDYFGAIHAELNDGGLETLLYDLQQEDLSDFNPRVMPVTAAGLDMKLKNASPSIRWLFEFLDSAYNTESPFILGLAEPWTIDQSGGTADKKCVYEHYIRFCNIEHSRVEADSAFWKSIKKAIPSIRDDRERTGDRRRLKVFPSLSEARREFEGHCKQPGKIVWSEPEAVTLDEPKIRQIKKAANSS